MAKINKAGYVMNQEVEIVVGTFRGCTGVVVGVWKIGCRVQVPGSYRPIRYFNDEIKAT